MSKQVNTKKKQVEIDEELSSESEVQMVKKPVTKQVNTKTANTKTKKVEVEEESSESEKAYIGNKKPATEELKTKKETNGNTVKKK